MKCSSMRHVWGRWITDFPDNGKMSGVLIIHTKITNVVSLAALWNTMQGIINYSAAKLRCHIPIESGTVELSASLVLGRPDCGSWHYITRDTSLLCLALPVRKSGQKKNDGWGLKKVWSKQHGFIKDPHVKNTHFEESCLSRDLPVCFCAHLHHQ